MPVSVSLEIIDVGDWDVHTDPLRGSRVKNTIIEPENGQLYVFKETRQGREAQIWSELIASYVAGDLLGWPVQHVSVASKAGTYGNLMRYVFENPDEEFVEGWRYCRARDADYDIEQGQRHTLPLLMSLIDDPPVVTVPREDYLAFWARVFALDALISNSDRHAENWAVISKGGVQRMSPLYDNATSLGCQLDPVGLNKWFDPASSALKQNKLDSYMAGGRHHVRLDLPPEGRASFEDLGIAFLQLHPHQAAVFQHAGALNLEAVDAFLEEIRQIEGLPPAYQMSVQRQNQIAAILKSGVERIKNILQRSQQT